MPLKGKDLAWRQMENQGWTKGQGLGRNGQGMLDAIKPKLKFDQSGIGHNRGEEFEFHWWDHVFNKAAKGITVNDSGGEIRVEFSTDKSEVSTKKLRKRMQKEMRGKLYSHFVKSGTLTGGTFTQEAGQDQLEEEADQSKIRTLTDEELVKACGGRTAHKGARHGQKMSGKLQRLQEAEQQFLLQMKQQQAAASQSTAAVTPATIHLADSPENGEEWTVAKAKKKKKKKDKVKQVEEEPVVVEERTKKKKRAKVPSEEVVTVIRESSETIVPAVIERADENNDGCDIDGCEPKKKAKKKRKHENIVTEVERQEGDAEEEIPEKKKKKSKRGCSVETLLD